ncbi:hypothetical protein H1164_17215 [Thermoactinomyces daqus]|uniref:NAD-dependent DNA ligase adenylation domain-containing protein n=1 Tax=Thermoactinomyces daqus TaxID=1329516 RepID=A0A7W1XDC2_9BACL|nr:hypothetical protein [Thermoactinomyces daqus]MBA4544570.1 hypothetical protein [Thermoactinomyces daqus]
MNKDILELINRRRRQILIHSFLYYRMNTSVIPDLTFDQWARELAELQRKYPEISCEGIFADAFADFSESITGFNLPLNDPWVIATGMYILRICNEKQ